MPTTLLTTLDRDIGNNITGEEEWEILGNAVEPQVIQEIIQACSGLNYYWNCLEKAEKAQEILGRGTVIMGSLMVVSADFTSEYGHYWNPPFEFHAWVDLRNGSLVDIGLPGVIEKGLTTSDHIGPALIGRTPSVLAGPPPFWLKYQARMVYMKVGG